MGVPNPDNQKGGRIQTARENGRPDCATGPWEHWDSKLDAPVGFLLVHLS